MANESISAVEADQIGQALPARADTFGRELRLLKAEIGRFVRLTDHTALNVASASA